MAEKTVQIFENVSGAIMILLPLHDHLRVAAASRNLQECLSLPSMWEHIKFSGDYDVAGMQLQAVDLKQISRITKSRIQAAR